MRLNRSERELWALLRADPVARNLAHRLAWTALAWTAGAALLGGFVAAIAYGGLP